MVASHFWSRDWPTCRWHHLARKSARFLADGKFVCLSSSFSSVRSRAHPASISLFGISASFRREEFIYVAAISLLGPQNLIGMLGFNLKWTWTSTRSLMILIRVISNSPTGKYLIFRKQTINSLQQKSGFLLVYYIYRVSKKIRKRLNINTNGLKKRKKYELNIL